MDHLPNTTIPCFYVGETKLVFTVGDEIDAVLSDYLSADCWALVVNDEVIYNAYVDKTVKENVMEDVMRSHIIKNPHATMLCSLYRQSRDFVVRLFMFGTESWEVRLSYSVNDN